MHCNAGWRDFSFLRIHTDEGISGISEYNECYGSPGLSHIIDRLMINLLSENPLHNEKIHLTGIKNRFRDFIYVTDAVDSIIASIERNETDVYNIGSGVKIKINEIAEKIISIIKSKSIITKFYRKTDFDSILDISKAENKLGFKPKTCLDEGLKYEIEWHKKNK